MKHKINKLLLFLIPVCLIIISIIGFLVIRAVYRDFNKTRLAYIKQLQISAATGFVNEHDGYKSGKITLSGNDNPDAYKLVFLENERQWGYFSDNKLENIHKNPDNPDAPYSAICHEEKIILMSVGDIGKKGRDSIFAELYMQYEKIP